MTAPVEAALAADRPLAWWRVGRAVAAVVSVASVATLAVFSLWPSSVRTSVTTSRSQADAAPAAPPQDPVKASAASQPAVSGTSAPQVVEDAATPATGTSLTPGSELTPAPSTPGEGDSPAPGPAVSSAQCPLGLPGPSRSGGLQSLVGFAPAFGPFASEAFAMAPAYAPLLQLFGPLVAEFAAESANGSAVVQPVLTVLGELDTAGFDVFEPFYGPRRSQVLGYETQLATALAPYSEELASSAPGACLVDLEGMLVSAGSAP